MAKIVGLMGLKGSGKDTVADHLVAVRGYTRLAFADPLRDEVMQGFGVTLQDLLARETKETPQAKFALQRCGDQDFVRCMLALSGPQNSLEQFLRAPRSPREILQVWGTEYRRADNPSYWVDQLFARLPAEKDCVITDVRFLIEAQRLYRHNAILLRVRRPAIEAQMKNGEGHWQHASELEQAQIKEDATLLNEENKLAELYAQVDKALGYFDYEMA